MLLDAGGQVGTLRRQRLRLGQVHQAVDVGRVGDDLVHAHVVAGAGAEDDALSHGPGAQTLAAQRAVDDGAVRAQVEEIAGHVLELGGDGRAGQLDVAGAAGPEDDHLAQGCGDAGGHEDLLGHVAQTQHILGRGDQGTLLHEDAGLLRAGDYVGGLTIPSDGGQTQCAAQVITGQQPVEHGGLASILAHTHDGHGLRLVEPAQQLIMHIVHALSLVFSQFLSITYPFEKRKGGNAFPPFPCHLSECQAHLVPHRTAVGRTRDALVHEAHLAVFSEICTAISKIE